MNDPAPAKPQSTATADQEQAIRAYHERSKHQLNRYARGPETLDWDNQPHPFRRFDGSPRTGLPYPALIGRDTQPTIDGLSTLLRFAFGLSAWKAFGPDRWSLRCNPSSGNLHPTEVYVICAGLRGVPDGVHHYAAHDHLLEHRCEIPSTGEAPALLIAISSIHWREAWKYGERAYRYCQLDTGHALGALRFAAQLCGWTLELLPVPDRDIATLAGLDREQDFASVDRETPELLVRIGFTSSDLAVDADLSPWLSACQDGSWQGRASPLGGEPRLNWPEIDKVAEACRQQAHWPLKAAPTPVISEVASRHSLAQTILQRRSAQAFDSHGGMSRDTFFSLLSELIPSPDKAPWDCWPDRARLHLALFVHRVEGIPRGLYCLSRHPDALVPLRSTLRDSFDWQRPEGCPPDLPLYRLVSADSRKAARTLSCHQEIAAGGIFSLGMLAEFDRVLEDQGPTAYRHLYWEAGLLGQVLYLAAEQHGYRGTGIGCFFDDAVHETLGIEGTRYQSLYHFTVGTPREDSRIQAFPPYEHLARRQMAQLKQQIAALYARREALKAKLETGEARPQDALRTLELLDAELSDLDTRFKTLWDENGDL